jgi:transposase
MEFKLSVLRREAKCFRLVCPRTYERLLVLIELRKHLDRRRARRFHNVDLEIIGARMKISARTVRRWLTAYLRQGSGALVPKPISGRPRKVIRGRLAKRIVEMRRRYGWGAEVIHEHLARDHGIGLGQYRIHEFLRRKDLLRKSRRQKRKKNKHTRRVIVKIPGAHTQIDVKYLTRTLTGGRRCYVYSFIDHASKWRFKRAFEMFGNLQTQQFMEELLKCVPFAILRLQSDNGGEFTNRFNSHPDAPKPHLLDEICVREGIRHRLIPPGEKELQGLVERSHRQDDEELYHRHQDRVHTIAGLNQLLDEYCAWANARRRRKALGWLTSDEWLADYRRQNASVHALVQNSDKANDSTDQAA